MKGKQDTSESGSRGLKVMIAFGVLLLVLPLIVYWLKMDAAEPEDEETAVEPIELVTDEKLMATSENTLAEIEFKDRPQNLDLDWIVDAHVRAMGGRERLLAVNTTIIDCTFVREEDTMSVVSMRKRPRNIFQKTQFGDIDATFWSNGESVWREVLVNGELKDRRKLEGEDLNSTVYSLDYDSPIIRFVLSYEYPDTTHPLKFEGEGEHSGVSGYWVSLEDDLGIKRRIFINKETMLIDYEEVQSEAELTLFTYSDYREVDGLMKSFRQDIEIPNKEMRSIVEVRDYRLNTFMYSTLFTPTFAE